MKRFSGQLRSKDPFAGVQTVTAQTIAAPRVRPTPPAIPSGSPTGGKGGSMPGGSGTSTTTTPQAVPYIYAVVMVNGVAEGVSVAGSFPAASPLFDLDAITDKSIRFSLLDGTFANGLKQVSLLKGHKLKLRNTADGSTFVIELITTSKTMPTATTPPATAQTSTSILVEPRTSGGGNTNPSSPPPPTAPADTTTSTTATG